MSGNKGSGNNNNNKEVELDVFNRFYRIVRARYTGLSGDNGDSARHTIDALYKRPEYASEKRVLNGMNNMGLQKAVLSGLATFVFLRISPRLLARAARAGMIDTTSAAAQNHNNPFHQSSSSLGGYKFDSITGGGVQTNDRPGLFFKLLRLSLDTFVSLSIGASAQMYFIDKDKMMKSFSDIPLVEGRSLLSEELCDDFSNEFKKFDRKIWENHPSLSSGGMPNMNNTNGGKEFRNTILGFVANCKRRRIYETELRTERRFGGDDDNVPIPPPGVPTDIAVSLEDLMDNEEDNQLEMKNGDDFFDTHFNMKNKEED